MYWRVSAVILSIVMLRVIFRILTAIQTPPEAIAAWQVLTSFLAFGLLLWAAWGSRHPVAAWFGGMIHPSRLASFEAALARHWLAIAVSLFFVLFLAQLHGALTQRFAVSTALLLTVNLLIGLVLFETLLHFVKHRLSGATSAAPAKPRAADLVARCVRVGIYIAFCVTVTGIWIVDVFGLVDSSQWRALWHEALTVGGALFAAYVGWEIIHFMTDSYIVRNSPTTLVSAEDDGAPPSATRLATLMPLLRMTFVILIFVVAALVVLSELGVNITPLIAGASVFGLALSFGSQTLVRDIVSGIFYLADDAFRVGEYIDSGKAKGTVEGFTLRSIKLRHQNGQLYTIPFGQLGQITNFSRDWTTMKFNLRFARDTDVEKLRKTVEESRPCDDGGTRVQGRIPAALEAPGRCRRSRQCAGDALQIHREAEYPDRGPARGDEAAVPRLSNGRHRIRQRDRFGADRRRAGRPRSGSSWRECGHCTGGCSANPRLNAMKEIKNQPAVSRGLQRFVQAEEVLEEEPGAELHAQGIASVLAAVVARILEDAEADLVVVVAAIAGRDRHVGIVESSILSSTKFSRPHMTSQPRRICLTGCHRMLPWTVVTLSTRSRGLSSASTF